MGGAFFDAVLIQEDGKRQCLGQELLAHTLMMVHFTVNEATDTTQLQLQMWEDEAWEGSPEGKPDPPQDRLVFSESGKSEISTVITAHRDAMYWVCAKTNHNARVQAIISTGRHHKPVALLKDKHLQPTEEQLNQVIDGLDNYHANLMRIRQKEEETFRVTDQTTSWIMWVALFNMVLTVAASGWQMFAIKVYLRQKKII